MQCKKCGTEIKDGCLFCHNCGEAVQIVPDYEPELEELDIHIEKDDKVDTYISPREQKSKQKDDEKKESGENKKAKKKSSSKQWWVLLGSCLAVVCVIAFFVAYGFVLKNQEPDAMQQNGLDEEIRQPVDVANPEFSLPGGEYTYYITVKLSTQGKGTIYYTLDGSIPDESSFVYEKPLELSKGKTVVRAFVMDENGNCSDVISHVYRIVFGAPDPPVIVPGAGNYEGEHYIRILVPEGCVAYYTLDGSEPAASSEIYTGEFLMPTGTTTVRAILEDENGYLSEISSVQYFCGNLETEN